MTLRRALAFIAVFILSATASCGGGASTSSLENDRAFSSGMPTVPFTPPDYMHPAVDPMALMGGDAIAELPAEGIMLFAQDGYNRVVSDLPLILSAARSAGGLEVTVCAAKDAELPRDLLLYLRFDPQRFNPSEASLSGELFPSRTHLQLVLTDQRGFVPLAASALPSAAAVRVKAADKIARVSFTLGPQTARRNASAAPTGDGNTIEITAQVLGDNIRCLFSERNIGDYNLDGTVGVADITAIAQHWHHKNADVQDEVIDVDNSVDGVGITDITPIAMHFGTVLSGYDIELEFTPEGGSAGEFDRIPNETDVNKPTMTRPSVTLPSGWPTYTFVADNQGYGTYRFRAYPIGATLAERGDVSNTSSGVYQNLPPAPPASFWVSETTRTTVTLEWYPSPAQDIAGYNVYWTANASATTLSSYVKANPILMPEDSLIMMMVGLTPSADYWFVIESVDDRGLPAFESQTLGTKVHAQTIVTPVAVLNVEAGEHYELYQITFDGIGSNSPDGAAIVTYTYDWGDGTTPEVFPTPDPVTHTYQFPYPGGVNVKLTVEDEYGVEGSTQQSVVVGALRKDVLVVYNTNSADDLEIANYYASPFTGRAIHPDCVLGLPLSMQQAIDRVTFESTLRDPIRTYLNGIPAIKASVKYIVTTMDVPLQISTGDPYDPPPPDGWQQSWKDAYNYTNTNQACVDSELTLLFQTYDTISWKDNPYYGARSSSQTQKGAPAQSRAWQTSLFTVDETDNDVTTNEIFHWPGETYSLDFLVTRLSGWSKADALALVDRSKQSDSALVTSYTVVFDDDNKSYDMMNSPTADGTESAISVMSRLGLSYYSDTADQSVKADASILGASANTVIGYCSHGVHSGLGSTYILDFLGFTYLPGALFMSYESFNGQQFRGNPIGHGGHGQVADFVYMGGTGGIGNVYEPLSSACGDESYLFPEYINCGRNLAEACYKSLRYVSWMEVVLGDPLCKVTMQ